MNNKTEASTGRGEGRGNVCSRSFTAKLWKAGNVTVITVPVAVLRELGMEKGSRAGVRLTKKD